MRGSVNAMIWSCVVLAVQGVHTSVLYMYSVSVPSVLRQYDALNNGNRMAAMWRNHQPSAHQAISEELSHVILHIMIDMNGQRQPCRRRVCLFGLSADPPTAAHVEMAHRLSQQDLDFQEIRIMPVYRHQFAVSKTLLCINGWMHACMYFHVSES